MAMRNRASETSNDDVVQMQNTPSLTKDYRASKQEYIDVYDVISIRTYP